jgi:predicted amidophosphoribosyltransferase
MDWTSFAIGFVCYGWAIQTYFLIRCYFEKPKCPNCQTELEKGVHFCPNCHVCLSWRVG